MESRIKLDLDDICGALSKIFHSFDKVYICIDALNECTEEQRWNLIDILQRTATSNGSGSVQSLSSIKLFFTGRPQMEKYVNAHAEIQPAIPLSVKLEASTHDIAAFIKNKISMDTKVKMTEEFRNQLIDEIVATSRGMFVIQSISVIPDCNQR
jgi:hypothetical protein